MTAILPRALVGIALALVATAAGASAFCVARDLEVECTYRSADECITAAGTDGECIVNFDARRAHYGSERFCVVSARLFACSYLDTYTCKLAAQDADGLCIVNPYRRR